MRFSAVDLSGLEPPNVVEDLDYEAILADLKVDCVQRMTDSGVDYDVEMLESDPVVKILEVAAYREMLLRARVNTAAKAVLLAKSQEADLDHLGVYYGVARELVRAATSEEPALYETDARLRERIQLAPEAFSVAGPKGAYVFHAMAVDPSIKSVHVYTSSPGTVHVLPLVDTGDGLPSADILNRVRQRLMRDDISPLTDNIIVRAPTRLDYTISLDLKIANGPDPAVVRNLAIQSIQAYLSRRHVVGAAIRISGLIAAAHVPGVEKATLASPTADILPGDGEVAHATNLTVTTS